MELGSRAPGPVLLSAVALLAILATGCSGPCQEIAARRATLANRASAAAPHGRLHVPLARANELIAESLAARPLEAPIGPELIPVRLPIELPTLLARVAEVQMVPGRPGRVGFAVRIVLLDGDTEVVTLSARAEVRPRIVRDGASMALVLGLDGDSLVAVEPRLGPDSRRRLADALSRWLPDAVRRRMPRPLLERGASELASRLTGTAYRGLRASLLSRLGEVTRVRIGLPEVPIERVAVRSTTAPLAALALDLFTALPVRRGLARAVAPASDQIQLRLAGSTVAEIANWAIDHGHLPGRYTRTLRPRPDGEFRPVFDWVGAGSPRGLVLHVFQERGGCSYLAVGVRPEVAVVRGSLVATLRDREIIETLGPVTLQIGVWLKSLVSRAADTTRRFAATTRLEAGGRRFDTRVTRAVLERDELVLDLVVSARTEAALAFTSSAVESLRGWGGPHPARRPTSLATAMVAPATRCSR